MGLDFHEAGVPTVDPDDCSGCGACARICPTGTLKVDDGKLKVGAGGFMGCIGCGHCMMVCPEGNIRVTGRRFFPEDVCELPSAAMRATADQLDGLLLSRRSVRRFTNQEVDRSAVDRILEMVRTGPTGVPPNETGIVVIHGREKVHAFAEETIAVFDKTVRFFNPVRLTLMRPLIGKIQHASMRDFVKPILREITENWKQGRDTFCYDAPLAMIFHHAPTGDQTDAHIVTTYAMLAAQSLGLGSCWLGTVAALNHDKPMKRKYRVADENEITGMLVMGHPAVSFQRSVRRRLASIEFV